MVGICEGSMDNEEREIEEEVGFSTFDQSLNLF